MVQIDKKSQLEARDYVLNKQLQKPPTTIIAPILLVLGIIALGVILGLIISNLVEKYIVYVEANRLAAVIGMIVFLLICMIKPTLILCIRCYQHYAPESIRRSCLCKPICSEYSIIVIKKYCIIKALWLIYIRLFKTCTEKIYKIDFPYKREKGDRYGLCDYTRRKSKNDASHDRSGGNRLSHDA